MTQSKTSPSEDTPSGNLSRDAYRYMLITAGVMALAIVAILFLFGKPANFYNTAYWAGLVGITALFGAWLTRQGRSDLGLGLLSGAFLVALLIPSIETSGLSVAFTAVGLTSIFSLSRLMGSPKLARYSKVASIAVVIFLLALDIFTPFERTATKDVTSTWIIAGGVTLTYIIIGLRQSWGNILTFLSASIRNRLTAIVVGAAIIPVLLVSLVLGWSTYVQVRNALTQDAFDKLTAVQAIKANQITNYLSERQGDMVVLSETMSSVLSESLVKMETINALKSNQTVRLFQTWDADVRDVGSHPSVITGMRTLASGFQALGAAQVRSLYLGKEQLQSANDSSDYSAAHAEQHGFFTGYTDIHGYQDAFLIDPAGNVVYSVHKNDAFATNLVTGTYKDGNLALLYKNLITAAAGKTYIADAAIFEANYAMFIGTPIYEGSTLVGILVYQLPLNTITELMADRTGQGKTGETYLVAREADGRITYRSDRVTAGDGAFVVGYDLTSIATQFMKNALGGQTGGGITTSSTGETVINAYRPLEIEGLNWAVLTRITAAEALSPIHTGTEKDFLTAYKETYGYFDVFLIEPNGFVFYSVTKEADYQSNMLTGEYKDSNLGALVAEIGKSKSFEFADFALYAPSGGKPAAFFGIPVLDANNEVQMIVAAQASLDQINAITGEANGLGASGETYLVGNDQLWRSDSRFLADLGAETTVLNQQFKVDTIASRAALNGESGQQSITDYRGIPVLSVWSPIVITEGQGSTDEGLAWALIAEVDQTEALAPVNALAGTLGLLIGLAVLVISALAVFLGARFAIGFVTPILNLTDTATQVAAGNMNLTVETKSTDEIGVLSNAFNSMTSQLRDLIGSLEARVAARTKDMATVAEVGTATATILETDKLMQAVVDLTKERFELYHSHIYLLDEAGENLVLTSGAGEAGRIMVSEKRSIPLNREQSLVARAAREVKGVIVNDVTAAPDFLPNPLLPNTRAELAVPMIVGGKVIGVFDVQSELVGRFTDSDVNIQTTLAAQVATSIQNVRSFEQSKTQADFESMVNAIGQKILRATTVEDTLQTAIREVGLALGASRVMANIQATRQDNGNDNKN